MKYVRKKRIQTVRNEIFCVHVRLMFLLQIMMMEEEEEENQEPKENEEGGEGKM